MNSHHRKQAHFTAFLAGVGYHESAAVPFMFVDVLLLALLSRPRPT